MMIMKATRVSVLSKIMSRRTPTTPAPVATPHIPVQDTDQFVIMVGMIDKGQGPYQGLMGWRRFELITALKRMAQVSPAHAETVVTLGSLGHVSMGEALRVLSEYADTKTLLTPVSL